MGAPRRGSDSKAPPPSRGRDEPGPARTALGEADTARIGPGDLSATDVAGSGGQASDLLSPGAVARTVSMTGVEPGEEPADDLTPGEEMSGRVVRSAGAAVEELGFGSVRDALLHDEIRRSRLLARFGLSMYVAVILVLPLLPQTGAMTWFAFGSLSLGALSSAWLIYLSRPGHYEPRAVTATWVMTAFAVGGGLIFFGVFSFAVIAMVIGVYWLALGNSLSRALFVYLIGATVQGTVATLIIAGVIQDPGFMALVPRTPHLLALCEFLFQVITAATFYTARASRHVTLSVVTDYERVVRALGQRDALLQEARDDLERALHQGGMGRFSGQTLGSYRLGHLIGRGGMGEVYEAAHATTGEPAAVKLLQPERLGNAGQVKRFLREVELASSISVPQIVRVLEVGDESSPVPYLVMELLRGRDLAEILRDRRRLDTDAVVDLLDQIGRGVDAAAAARIVHRDLKPQNLFLVEAHGGAREWKILDFGVSKLLDESAELTQNRVIGTPMYMAPEQAQGRPVDARTDLYALAAIAYRCITGGPPYRSRSVLSVIHDVIREMPVRPGALAEVTPEMDLALLVGMAKDPAARYASGAELAAAIDQARRGELSDDVRRRGEELAAVQPWRQRW